MISFTWRPSRPPRVDGILPQQVALLEGQAVGREVARERERDADGERRVGAVDGGAGAAPERGQNRLSSPAAHSSFRRPRPDGGQS